MELTVALNGFLDEQSSQEVAKESVSAEGHPTDAVCKEENRIRVIRAAIGSMKGVGVSVADLQLERQRDRIKEER